MGTILHDRSDSSDAVLNRAHSALLLKGNVKVRIGIDASDCSGKSLMKVLVAAQMLEAPPWELVDALTLAWRIMSADQMREFIAEWKAKKTIDDPLVGERACLDQLN